MTQTHKKFIDFDNQDDLEVSTSLDEGHTITEKITVNVPVQDIEAKTYRLYVKVYQDGKESKTLFRYFRLK